MLFSFTALLFATSAFAHTTIDNLQLIDPKSGNYMGALGYPRQYICRTCPGFTSQSNLVPFRDGIYAKPNHYACGMGQNLSQQANGYPMLKAAPGSFIGMRYTENGHTTLLTSNPGKPENGRGTVFIYATKNGKPDDKLLDVLNWTMDGKGGDGRGVLLAAQDYDDKRCYEGEANLGKARTDAFKKANPQKPLAKVPCESDLHLPDNMDEGKWGFYWVWQWPTLRPDIKQDEYYTTCMDIEVVKENTNTTQWAPDDAPNKAVDDFKSRTAGMADPKFGMSAGVSWSKGPTGTPFPSVIPAVGSGSGGGKPADPTPSPSAPAKSGSAPAPSKTPAPSASSIVASSPAASAPAASQSGPVVPSLSARPGEKPSSVPAPQPPAGGAGNADGPETVIVTNIVTVTGAATAPPKPKVTVTQQVTVTAPAAAPAASGKAKRDAEDMVVSAHVRRGGLQYGRHFRHAR